MTLVAAMRCSDAVIVAADGLALDEFRMRAPAATKLWPLPNYACAWGYTGPVALGEDVKARIDALPPQGSWSSLTAATAEAVTEANGVWRRRSAATGRAFEDAELCSLVLAGVVDGVTGILQVGPRGNHNTAAAETYAFIGGGAAVATVAYRTLVKGAAISRPAAAAERDRPAPPSAPRSTRR